MSIPSLVFFTLACIQISALPPPEVQLAFQKSQAPFVVLLGSDGALQASLPKWQEVMDADSMLDIGVGALRVVAEDQPAGRSLGKWLRSQQGFDAAETTPEMWVLMGREGRAIASGVTRPDATSLAQRLEAAGWVNPVKRLTAFLKAHPDHAEARRDLILALRRRLVLRLEQHPTLLLDGDVPPALDEKVWGPISRELDIFFQSEDWMALGQGLHAFIPAGSPERSSPLMRDLFRRLRPRMIGLLRDFPESTHTWTSLLRVDRVLGDGTILPLLKEVTLFHSLSMGLPSFVFLPLGRMVRQEAQRSGDWNETLVIYPQLWEQARLWLRLRNPLPNELGRDWRAAVVEREETWEHILSPWIEALVRNGLEGEISNLLGNLDDSWAPLKLDARLVSLSKVLGRPDLARSWVSVVRSLAPRVPAEGQMIGEFTLLIHHQKKVDGGELRLLFRQYGSGLTVLQVPESWKSRLGWSQVEPHWALVGLQGEVVLQGDVLPSARDLLSSFRKTGTKTSMDRTRTFLQEHPNHLAALAQMAGYHHMRAQSYWEDRRGARMVIGAPRPSLSKEEEDCWRDYFQTLRKILEHPLGTCPELLNRCAPSFLSINSPPDLPKEWRAAWEEELPEDLGGKNLARLALPRIEADLARRPSDSRLWESWLAFAPLMDRSPKDLIHSLEPSPAVPGGSWPPSSVLLSAAQQLKRDERWIDLAEMLQPLWETELIRLKVEPSYASIKAFHSNNWSWELTRYLVEARIQLGQLAEADAVLSGSKQIGPMDDLLGKARRLGYDAWAQRWTGPQH